MSLITKGYGINSRIVTKGYGSNIIVVTVRREVRRFMSKVNKIREFISYIG